MRHDVGIRVECGMTERLIERCAQSGIRFRKIRRIDGRTIEVYCADADARALLAFCSRHKINARQFCASDRSRLIGHIRKRWTCLIGIALCVAIMAAFLSRVWLIDVSCDDCAAAGARRAEIMAALRRCGVEIGMCARDVDPQRLQKQLITELRDAGFVGVRRQGVRLYVELRTEIAAPKTYEIARASDIVASRDGIITAIETDCGSPCVTVGDAVHAGQTLIRGEEAVSREETAPIAARGRVIASCWIEGSAQGSLTEIAIERTGATAADTSIRLPGVTVPLLTGARFAEWETERRVIPIVGMFLPVEMVRDARRETKTVKRRVNADALTEKLAEIARADAQAKLTAALPEDIEITDHWENIKTVGDIVTVCAVTEISTDIAIDREAYGRENRLGKH